MVRAQSQPPVALAAPLRVMAQQPVGTGDPDPSLGIFGHAHRECADAGVWEPEHVTAASGTQVKALQVPATARNPRVVRTRCGQAQCVVTAVSRPAVGGGRQGRELPPAGRQPPYAVLLTYPPQVTVAVFQRLADHHRPRRGAWRGLQRPRQPGAGFLPQQRRALLLPEHAVRSAQHAACPERPNVGTCCATRCPGAMRRGDFDPPAWIGPERTDRRCGSGRQRHPGQPCAIPSPKRCGLGHPQRTGAVARECHDRATRLRQQLQHPLRVAWCPPIEPIVASNGPDPAVAAAVHLAQQPLAQR